MLPFPSRQILPCEQIPISSVIAQNPPALLPPRSVYPLPICPSCRCRSQPLSSVSRKHRYNTLDFPRESRVPRKALPSFGNLPPRGTLFTSGLPLLTGVLLAPIGNPEPKGAFPLWTPHLFVQWLSILLPHVGYAPARTGKTGTEICPGDGHISVPVFVQRRLDKAYVEALQNPRSWLEIFVLKCENRLSQVPISGIIKQSNSLTEVPIWPSLTISSGNCSLIAK